MGKRLARHLTKLPGIPDADDIIPGMAYFPGTGPYGKTCGDCIHKGYWRDYRHKGGSYWYGGCAKYKQMAGRPGPTIIQSYPACKYFTEEEPK